MGAPPAGRWWFGVEPLPDFAISSAGDLGRDFTARGIHGFRAAARHLHRLPYGRITDPTDFRSVLVEQMGTCGTKHALIAALAAEHAAPVELWLGVYPMSERQSPGVARVLRQHGIESIPEAHCYLRCGDTRIDITSSRGGRVDGPLLMHEERIVPEQIGSYKREVHRSHLACWAAAHGFTAADAWTIREACIRMLAREAREAASDPILMPDSIAAGNARG